MTLAATSKINVLQQSLRWQKAGHGVALATVIKTWRSAPCPTGSLLAVRDDMLIAGSVSGGCVEAEVVQRAVEIIKSKQSAVVAYGVSEAVAWKAGLPCGGKIKIHIAPLNLQCQKIQIPTVLVTHLTSGERYLTDAPPQNDTSVFLNFFENPRLVIVGAGHIAQNLIFMALSLGYEVVLVEPREVFARPERFPQNDFFRIVRAWPDEPDESDALALDKHTALVALSHDPKIDDVALTKALENECFYIGALGSVKNHAARCERLYAAGIPKSSLIRIHAPVGLKIRAQTPGEIALSILAQITQIRHAPSIAAIVLAAGESQRTKKGNKLLLLHQNKPLIRHAVKTAMASRANPVIVVTGHQSKKIKKALYGLNPLFVHNPNYQDGIGTSIACGIKTVPKHCAGALVCLGDMPYVRPEHLNRLIESFNEKEHLCIPVAQGRQGNPVLWGRSFFRSLCRLHGDTGAKSLLPPDAHKIFFQDTAVLDDIDDIDDTNEMGAP